MEALMLSLMLAISMHSGLPMPIEPITIDYAPMSFEADPLVRFDGLARAIVVDVKFDATDPIHRTALTQALATVMRDMASAASARHYGAPAARDMAGVGGAR